MIKSALISKATISGAVTVNHIVDSIARIIFTSFYEPNCLFGGLPSFFFFFLGKRGDSSVTDEKATGAAGSG